MTLAKTTDQTFDTEVLAASQDRPVFVKFTADWCGPCRQVAPILEKLASERTDVTFVELDVDENVQTASAYRVSGIPTMKVFKGGEEVLSIVGARPYESLRQELEKI